MKCILSTFVSALAFAAAVSACEPKKAEQIDVSVLAILVSEHHEEVHPKLKGFAQQVQAKDKTLKGFRLERTSAEKLLLGETHTFDLVGDQKVEVTVNKERNKDGRIVLTIKPPKLKQITYECVCDKYFGMATQYYVGKGKDRQQLFIAVMGKPCGAKK